MRDYPVYIDLDDLFRDAPNTDIVEEVLSEIRKRYDRPISARESLGSEVGWSGLYGKVFGAEGDC